MGSSKGNTNDNSASNSLASFEGAVGLKTLIKKWDTLSANLKHYRADLPILLPDLFVTAQSSSRVSELVYELAGYLREKKNLMDFYGDVPYFEFMFNYCKPDTPFSEIQRLMDEVNICAGFRNVYKGIVHIRIDEWTGHQDEQHFFEFLDYISENTVNWLVVLSVVGKKASDVSALESALSMFLRIEKITLKTLSTESYVNEAVKQIAKYDLELDESAMKLLGESIDILRKNKYFDSSYTIRLLCSDIVYGVYSGKIRKSGILTAEDLKDFAVDSPYIQRTLNKSGIKIGFTV